MFVITNKNVKNAVEDVISVNKNFVFKQLIKLVQLITGITFSMESIA